ncbi:MAG: HEPN domain-containing protein [Chloroflexota bacterium]|nr:HEPN domain-containing protein [Chloroflexota bacterium]
MSEVRAIAESQRAEDCRQAAELCLRHGFYADSISRSYYAVLHAARAALALYDVTIKNHRGLTSMFGLHIVQAGLVEGHWGSTVGQLSALRMAADYDVEVVFAAADADGTYEQAVGFVSRIHTLLSDSIDPGRLQQQS